MSNIHLNNLKEGDYIAFLFKYNPEDEETIIVSNITSVHNYGFTVHFLYGHHSLSKTVKRSEVIAIGDTTASGKIKGWTGNYRVLINHPLIR